MNFYRDLDRILNRLDRDLREVEKWEQTDPDWRDLSRDPEDRVLVSESDVIPDTDYR